MVRLPVFLKALVAASLAAPPIFYWCALAASRIVGNAAAILGELDQAGGTVMFLYLAVFYGLIVALVPNLMVVTVMTVLGSQFPWARRPALWAIAGAGPAIALTLALGMIVGLPEFALALVATGIGSALVARFFLRWEEAQA